MRNSARLCACLGLLACMMAGPALPASPLEPDKLFEKVSPSVWTVRALDAQERPIATGSAVVVGPGRLITACHVLRGARAIQIRQDDVSHAATLAFPDAERDLCELSARNLRAPAVTVAPMSTVRVGQRVYAVGSPRGVETTLSEGLISSLRGGENGAPLIVHAAPLAAGSSGGGLFDSDGRLVGITTAQRRDAQSLYAAIPAEWIAEVPERGQAALDRRREAAAEPVPPPAPVSEFPKDITGEAFTKFFQANRTLNGTSADGRPLRFQLSGTYLDGFTQPNSMNPATVGGITASARGSLQMPAGTSQLCLNFNTSLNNFWLGQTGCYRLVQTGPVQYRLQPVKDGTDFTFSLRP